MDSRIYSAWRKAGFDLWMLGAEAGMVMTLRMARIAPGGSAGAAKAEPMVTEKVRAAIELQTDPPDGRRIGVTLLSATQSTLKHYRGMVAANNRRLRTARKR